MQGVGEGQDQLQQQLFKQESALAGSKKLRKQLTQLVSSLEQDLSDAHTVQRQAVQVSRLLAVNCAACCTPAHSLILILHGMPGVLH